MKLLTRRSISRAILFHLGTKSTEGETDVEINYELEANAPLLI